MCVCVYIHIFQNYSLVYLDTHALFLQFSCFPVVANTFYVTFV